MSPEAQRIAIAEACGWRCTNEGWVNADNTEDCLPDFLNDLNAIHEAEAHNIKQLQNSYGLAICEACDAEKPCSGWDYLHATAAQRAEAFLKTIGKWEEPK